MRWCTDCLELPLTWWAPPTCEPPWERNAKFWGLFHSLQKKTWLWERILGENPQSVLLCSVLSWSQTYLLLVHYLLTLTLSYIWYTLINTPSQVSLFCVPPTSTKPLLPNTSSILDSTVYTFCFKFVEHPPSPLILSFSPPWFLGCLSTLQDIQVLCGCLSLSFSI